MSIRILILILAALVWAGTAAAQTAGDDKSFFENPPTVGPRARTLAFYITYDYHYVGVCGISPPGDFSTYFCKGVGVSAMLPAGTFRPADRGAGARENGELRRVPIAVGRRALATMHAHHPDAPGVSAIVLHTNGLRSAENTRRAPGTRRADLDVPLAAQLVSAAVRRERGALPAQPRFATNRKMSRPMGGDISVEKIPISTSACRRG
jgi:hypothetical protein